MFAYLPILLTITGVFSLYHYRDPLFSPKRLFSPLKKEDKSERKQTYKTLLLALSGTLGVGNITGVATALLLGGEGSVFWMLISSILAIALKYAEATLSAKAGKGTGIPGVLSSTFRGTPGKLLSLLYAIAFLFLALVLGGAVQGNAIIENISTHLPLKKEYLAIALIFLLSVAVFGKTKRILHILSFTLPLASVVYLVMCLCILFTHINLLPTLLLRILKSAFSGIRPTISGVVGTLTSHTIREGYFAGLLSNEAGAGTSALAHEENAPVGTSGVVGVLEVLFDTTFLCTISALTFLLTDATTNAQNAGEVLKNTFLPFFGRAYIYPLIFSIIFLATSSSLCYLVYARRVLHSLSCDRFSYPFALLFLISIGVGGLIQSTTLVRLSHAILAVLSALTSLAIFASVKKEKTALPKRKNRFIFLKLFKNGKNC